MKENILLQSIDDKYLIASHLQKCVRLGLPELAAQSASRLYELDKAYLMYRTQIIAFEDVGIANVQLMKELIKFKWGVRQFEALNLDMKEYFINLNTDLAKSNKDRTSCDAICLIKMAYKQNDMKTLSKSFIKDIYQSWKYLGYSRYSIDSRKSTNDNIDNYISYINYCGVKSLFDEKEIIKFYNSQVDPWWIASMLLNPNNESNIKKLQDTSKYVCNDLDDEFCYSSIDGHTYLGKLLITKIINSNMLDTLDNLDVSGESLNYLIKKCLFRIEGQVIDNKLSYQQDKDIKIETQKKEIEYYFNISYDDYINLGKEMLSKMDEINYLRKDLLTNSLRKTLKNKL